MPDVDGFEIVRRPRRDGNRVPVIFLTARDTRDDKVTGLTIGGDDYITKPFGLEELAARVRTVLRRGPVGRPRWTARCLNTAERPVPPAISG